MGETGGQFTSNYALTAKSPPKDPQTEGIREGRGCKKLMQEELGRRKDFKRDPSSMGQRVSAGKKGLPEMENGSRGIRSKGKSKGIA